MSDTLLRDHELVAPSESTDVRTVNITDAHLETMLRAAEVVEEKRWAAAEAGHVAVSAVDAEPEANVEVSTRPRSAVKAASIAIYGAFNGQRPHPTMSRRGTMDLMGGIRIPRSRNPVIVP